jgi:hypothetical protein
MGSEHPNSPSTPVSNPDPTFVMSPQLQEVINSMMESKLRENEQLYLQELQRRQEIWQQYEKETKAHEAQLETQISDLTNRLASQSRAREYDPIP